MRAWRRAWGALLVGLLIGLASGPAARANDHPAPARLVCPICGRIADPDYGTKASHTLVRGAVNALLGWTEMIRQPAQEAKEGHSVFTGLNKGINRSFTRTMSGLGELVTFWAPKDRAGRYPHFAEDCPLCMGRNQ